MKKKIGESDDSLRFLLRLTDNEGMRDVFSA
jgi:hypothetical protein